jgi:hypothetical protein
MITEIEKKLILDLATGRISKEAFFKEYPVDLSTNVNYALALFENAHKEKDNDLLEYALLLNGYVDITKNRNTYIEIWRQLLREEWHTQHEHLVDILSYYKDPKDIDLFYEIALTKFDYRDYDDSESLAVKCIWTLGNIGTEGAKVKLELLAKSDNKIIKDNAVQQLKRLG